MAERDRQAKFPSAAGRIFDVLEVFSTFLAGHRIAAKEINAGIYVLSQFSFITIISQSFSALSPVFDQSSVCPRDVRRQDIVE